MGVSHAIVQTEHFIYAEITSPCWTQDQLSQFNNTPQKKKVSTSFLRTALNLTYAIPPFLKKEFKFHIWTYISYLKNKQLCPPPKKQKCTQTQTHAHTHTHKCTSHTHPTHTCTQSHTHTCTHTTTFITTRCIHVHQRSEQDKHCPCFTKSTQYEIPC